MFSPKFTITNKILVNVAKIEAAKEVIESAPLVPAYEAKFRQEAVVRAVHFGTHIEGNDLTFTQAQEVIEGRSISARDRDIKEVINYRKVMEFINTEGDKQKAINKEVLLKIHKLTVSGLVKTEQTGSYRYVGVVLRGVKSGTVTYSAPPASQVPKQVDQFLEWLNRDKDTHPVLKAAVTHYELVRIHPFTEGNGRTARALATLVLFKEDYDIKRFFSLEEHYDKDIQQYYKVLQNTTNQLVASESERDLTGWIEYFTEGSAAELGRIKDKVRTLSVDLRLKSKMGQVPLNERQLKLVEYMQQNGQVSNNEWRGLLPMISDDTILRELKYLMKKGLVRKRGKTKAAVYVLK